LAEATRGSRADDPFRVTVPLTGDGLGDAVLVAVLLLPQAASNNTALDTSAVTKWRLKIQLPSS
jgi:hypothetical protein